ncbi:hypothetical protein IJG04_02095 [Candidatus Saccharibacteria bacterium]|nr:hypothetical protein [Candidatus Saccharibacteria bacterium]
MKICICCSLSFTDEVKKIADRLHELGHEVLLPNGVIVDAIHKLDFDPVEAKRGNGYDFVREHFKKIEESDAMLVCNFTKNGIDNYVGANTFLEMGFAYYVKKPIYALNPLPDYKYINDELLNFDVIVINGDLLEIKE